MHPAVEWPEAMMLSKASVIQGVTKHRRSGRWEAHVWVREDGKQAYVGGYSTEEEAAEAHDVAALKCHGLKAKTDFHISRCFPGLTALHQHQCFVLHAFNHVPPSSTCL